MWWIIKFMDRFKLEHRLQQLGVNPAFYSLDGTLCPDSVVLYNSYDTWNVFYLSERGNREKSRTFRSEEDACDYIYNLFKESINLETSKGR